MNPSAVFHGFLLRIAASLALAAAVDVSAQPAAPAGSAAVPDGAPVLGKQEPIGSGASSTAPGDDARAGQGAAAASLQVREERVQGRLASAQVSVGGRSYLIVDPAAGRYDRQADNGGRHVTPVLWQLFRF